MRFILLKVLKSSLVMFMVVMTINADQNPEPSNYDQLVDLFQRWREFETPPISNGAPDYTTKQFESKKEKFLSLVDELEEIDTTNWTTYYKVDMHIVKAEMNGYDFNFRVVKPWERYPTFYQTK